MNRSDAARRLAIAHTRLEHESIIELELRSADELLEADGRPESGVESLAGILVSARRLPERVTIQLVLPAGHLGIEHTEATFRQHCRAQAECAWRRATTIRRGGRRQLAPSLAVAAAAATIGVTAGTAAQSTGSHVLAAALYVIAGIGVIASWVIAWIPIEELLFDWRPDGRTAHAYELLAASRLETSSRTAGSRSYGNTTARLG